jgi:crotonobetainyl-CoA:carnitine CoA-transferase CaiB-like acyl-CoA transferase
MAFNAGQVKLLNLPVKLKKTPGKIQGPPLLLGEHTEEILFKMGYTDKGLAGIEAQGITKIHHLK